MASIYKVKEVEENKNLLVFYLPPDLAVKGGIF